MDRRGLRPLPSFSKTTQTESTPQCVTTCWNIHPEFRRDGHRNIYPTSISRRWRRHSFYRVESIKEAQKVECPLIPCLMQTRFDEQSYRKRAQVETVMSMIKRPQGSFCKGKTYWSRCRELHLMALTHNIMILLPMQTFLKSLNVPLFCIRKIQHLPWWNFVTTDASSLFKNKIITHNYPQLGD